ncbi:MAG: alpha/beta fold hydrolase [Chloroflexota bacterium]
MRASFIRLLLPILACITAAACLWLAQNFDLPQLNWISIILCLIAALSTLHALHLWQIKTDAAHLRAAMRRMLVFSLLALLLILAAGSMWITRSRVQVMIHPGRTFAEVSYAKTHIPDFQNVQFVTPDGLTLRGWYVPPHNKALVIFLHGHGGNRQQLALEAGLLVQQGYGALLYDARNCGESEGTITTLGLTEVNDMRGALQFLQSQPQVDPERIGLLGHSMGGSTALMAAAQIPQVRAVVSESAYASLEQNIRENLDHLLGLPPFPFAPLVIFWGQQETGLDISQANPVDQISTISPRPVLIIHGEQDSTILVENAHQLYQAARQPKELWILPDAMHCCLAQVGGEAYAQKLLEFFNQALLSP